MSDEDVLFICGALQKVVFYYDEWQKAYLFNPCNNEFDSLGMEDTIAEDVSSGYAWGSEV